MRFVVLLVSVLIGSCTAPSEAATQVELTIEADELVRAATTHLEVEVGVGAGANLTEDDFSQFAVRSLEPDFPVRITLAPRGNQASHRIWVQVRAFEDDTQQRLISQGRILGSYVQGEVVELRLMLHSNCAQSCAWNTTCDAEGGCVSAETSASEEPGESPVTSCDDKERDRCGVCDGDGTSCIGCDGMVNSGLVEDSCGVCDGPGPLSYYFDDDEDGLGDPDVTVSLCGSSPMGYVESGTDPDDSCANAVRTDYYRDQDGDGLGDPDVTMSLCGSSSMGYVESGTDPDDSCAGGVTDACGVCAGDNSSCAGCDGVPNSGRVHECASVSDSCTDSDTLQNCALDGASCRVASDTTCSYGCTAGSCCVEPASLCASGGGSAECGTISNSCGLEADCGSCSGGSEVCYLNSCSAFVSVWRIGSAGESITLPLRESDDSDTPVPFSYDFQVDWGDGSAPSTVTSFDALDRVHTYDAAGDYTVVITGLMEAVSFYEENCSQLIEIPNLGAVGWKSFNRSFYGCRSLRLVAGGDTSSVTDMGSMFSGAMRATPSTSGWDTSSVTDMSEMFSGATGANPDTSSWDTSSVTDMSLMFREATSANPEVSSWDTSSVTDMRSMFNYASSANPDVSGWDTSSVTDMRVMFAETTSANPDTSRWDTSSVTSMILMFCEARSANPDVSSWDTSSVTSMRYMFNGAGRANPDTSSWDTSSVTDMTFMFGLSAADQDTLDWWEQQCASPDVSC